MSSGRIGKRVNGFKGLQSRKLTAAQPECWVEMHNRKAWQYSMASSGQVAGLASRSRQTDEGFRWDFQSATGFGLHMPGFALAIRSRFGEDSRRDCGGALVLGLVTSPPLD